MMHRIRAQAGAVGVGLLAVVGLAHAQPANNACANATPVSVGSYNGTTATATNDGTSFCGSTGGSRDVWYSFTAPANKELIASTCGGAGWDTVLSIHTGCPGTAANSLSCNDDACGVQSTTRATVQAGSTYYIRVGGYNGASGSFTLTIDLADPPPPPTHGPDVIVGDLQDIAIYPPAVGGYNAYAVGTTSCNSGDAPVAWYADTNRHPVIAQNMYRIKGGVFTQIGQSWTKHGFASVNGGSCGPCTQPPDGGAQLGIGCSDPYGAGLNGGQGGLGPRSIVNPTTGAYPYPYSAPGIVDNISRRLKVATADVTPANNAGAMYLIEGHYITADDAQWNNGLNNASWRRINITSATATPTMNGATHRQQTAIEAWHVLQPAATATAVDYTEQNLTARFWVGTNVIDNGNGTWTYVYAIHNMNSNRCARALTLPKLRGVTVEAPTFSAPPSHSGEPYSNEAWGYVEGANSVGWSTQSFQQNANANAIRWGTCYTFTIKANRPPAAGQAQLGFFRPGDGESLTINVPVPSGVPCDADFNGDGFVDLFDIDAFANCFDGLTCPQGKTADFNGDGFVDFFDFAGYVDAFETGC